MTTFVQLFQINRLLCIEKTIQLYDRKSIDASSLARAKKIISQLNTKNGLIDYLSHDFQDDDIALIDSMFRDAYSTYTEYFDSSLVANQQNGFIGKYQIRFWNVQDLVRNVFCYLRCNDLCSCSLVNSIIMYTALGSFSIQLCCSWQLGIKGMQKFQYEHNIRFWQRFTKARYIRACHYELTKHFLSFIDTLKHLKVLEIQVKADILCAMLKSIQMNHLKLQVLHTKIIKSITKGNCKVNSYNDYDCRLDLPNARYVKIDNRECNFIQFPVFLSEKCEWLELIGLHWQNIKSLTNAKHFINLKSLLLENIHSYSIKDKSASQSMVDKAEILFNAVKYFEFRNVNMRMIKFWCAMKHVIISNKAQVFVGDIDTPNQDVLNTVSKNYTNIDHYWLYFKGHQSYDNQQTSMAHKLSLKQLLHKASHSIKSIILQSRFNINGIFHLGLKMPHLQCLQIQMLGADNINQLAFKDLISILQFIQQQQQYQTCAGVLISDIDTSTTDLLLVESCLEQLLTIIKIWIQENTPMMVNIRIIDNNVSQSLERRKSFVKFARSFQMLQNELDNIQPKYDFANPYCTLMSNPTIASNCGKKGVSTFAENCLHLKVRMIIENTGKNQLKTALNAHWNAKILSDILIN